MGLRDQRVEARRERRAASWEVRDDKKKPGDQEGGRERQRWKAEWRLQMGEVDGERDGDQRAEAKGD